MFDRNLIVLIIIGLILTLYTHDSTTEGPYVAVSVGGYIGCALQKNGTAICWAQCDYELRLFRWGNLSSITAGFEHVYGIDTQTHEVQSMWACGESRPSGYTEPMSSIEPTFMCGLTWPHRRLTCIDNPDPLKGEINLLSFTVTRNGYCAINSEHMLICSNFPVHSFFGILGRSVTQVQFNGPKELIIYNGTYSLLTNYINEYQPSLTHRHYSHQTCFS